MFAAVMIRFNLGRTFCAGDGENTLPGSALLFCSGDSTYARSSEDVFRLRELQKFSSDEFVGAV